MAILATVTLVGWVFMAAITLHSFRRLYRLEQVGAALAGDPPLPRLSIVVAARNEERAVERGLRSLLALDYPDYEVIFVNDRSGDRTGEIADRLGQGDDRLRVIHVKRLPAGWFGKNHAAWLGATTARGELLLFTDGDVMFGPEAVARGARHLLRHRLDHVSVAPRLTVKGPLLQACMIACYWAAHVTGYLWTVRDPRSPASFGVGAYNLFRTASYHAIGGHRRVALRPDEDFQMGRLVKLSGMRSDHLLAESSVRCEWYRSVGGFVRGTEKNFFALAGYRLSITVARTAGLLWVSAAPFVLAVALAPVDARAAALFAASAMVAWGLAIHIARRARFRWWTGFAFPVAVAVVVHSWWRSAIITIRHGVAWGGSPIPLSELRAARVRPVEDPAPGRGESAKRWINRLLRL